MHRSSWYQRNWPTVAGAVITAFCACLAIMAAWRLCWRQVPATVITTSITTSLAPGSKRNCVVNVVAVRYSYTYASRDFESRRSLEQFRSLAAATSFANQYPTGKELRLWVNPFDPSQSTLSPGGIWVTLL